MSEVSWDIVLWGTGNSFKYNVKKPFFRKEVFEELSTDPSPDIV